MEAPGSTRRLPLRLEPALALGLPARGAARGRVPVAAAADAPGDLGLPGRDDGRDDARDARRRSRSGGSSSSPPTGSTSREGRHRPRLGASGAPGHGRAAARAARERRARGAPGRHRHERAVGRPPPLRRVPPRPGGVRPGLRRRDARRRRARGRDVVLPQSSFDLAGLAAPATASRDAVLVSSPEAIRRSNDKAETYALLDAARRARAGVAARQRRGRGRGGRARARLPGPRRVLQARVLLGLARLPHPRPDRRPRATSCCTSGPARVAMRLEEAVELLPREGDTELLVMELAKGGERTIDGIADGGRVVLGHPKTREAMRAGLAMYFLTLDDAWLMEIADPIVAELAHRPLLQHPARRRPRDRDQPAHLDDRLPGGLQPAVPRRQARARRDLGRGARRAARRGSGPGRRRCATSTSSSGTPEQNGLLHRVGNGATRSAHRMARSARCSIGTWSTRLPQAVQEGVLNGERENR